MGCWSSRQKSFSFSPCRLQFSFSSSSELCLLTCMKASQTFFRAKFEGTLDLEAFFLHTGHSRIPESQQRFRQPRQKLWLHDSKTGSVKMSQHIGHVRSSSGSDMVITLFCLFTKSTDSKHVFWFKSYTIPLPKTYLAMRRESPQPKALQNRNCLPIVLDVKRRMLSCLWLLWE